MRQNFTFFLSALPPVYSVKRRFTSERVTILIGSRMSHEKCDRPNGGTCEVVTHSDRDMLEKQWDWWVRLGWLARYSAVALLCFRRKPIWAVSGLPPKKMWILCFEYGDCSSESAIMACGTTIPLQTVVKFFKKACRGFPQRLSRRSWQGLTTLRIAILVWMLCEWSFKRTCYRTHHRLQAHWLHNHGPLLL